MIAYFQEIVENGNVPERAIPFDLATHNRYDNHRYAVHNYTRCYR